MGRDSVSERATRLADAPGEASVLLPLERLGRFLDREGVGSGPVEATRCEGGHSNVTYLVSRGEAVFALRRPPLPPLPPSAHDVLREAGVLRGLYGSGVPVPAVVAICEDVSVLGAPFYMMEFLDGVVLSDATPQALDDASARREIADQAVDALVALHAVDWSSRDGLARLGKPDGYLERQLRRFAGLWDRGRTRELPQLDEVTHWLERNLPDGRPTAVVHGDYRLGNLMYAPRLPVTLLGVLDWEMATLGDPLADLGYLTAHWAQRTTPGTVMSDLQPVTREPGFPDDQELAARYAESTGHRVENLAWYQVLALWKSAIFLEQSYQRFLSGNSADPWFAQMAEGVPGLIASARRTAGLGI